MNIVIKLNVAIYTKYTPRISAPRVRAKYIIERKPKIVIPVWDENTVMLDL